MFHTILNAFQETLFMVLTSGFLTVLIGLPLGFLIFKHQTNHSPLVKLFKIILQVTESTPYVILILALMPIIQLLMDNTLVTHLDPAMIAIIPLTLSSIPYFSRSLANALNQVPKGLIDLAKSMGATPLQIVRKILIPESLPYIIKSLTQTLVQLIGFATLVGALGYGGLGQLVINKGHPSLELPYLVATFLILITLVQLIQRSGAYLAHGTLKHI
jgi:D-methionine transport system permease protein